MAKRWSKPWGAGIGFVLLAAYIVIPKGNEYGWAPDVAGYLIGTAIGAGIAGAVVGWLICALQNKRASKT